MMANPISHSGHEPSNQRRQELRQSYFETLQELTFNSKVHIDLLTEIAEQNIEMYSDIVQLIEERIRTVAPNLKLFSLYLLDSIVKRVGGVYQTEFSKNIVTTFLGAFNSIKDDQTRNLFLKVLKTWPQYFPPEVIRQIETAIFQQHAPQQALLAQQQPSKNFVHVNPQFFQRQPQVMAQQPFGPASGVYGVIPPNPYAAPNMMMRPPPMGVVPNPYVNYGQPNPSLMSIPPNVMYPQQPRPLVNNPYGMPTTAASIPPVNPYQSVPNVAPNSVFTLPSNPTNLNHIPTQNTVVPTNPYFNPTDIVNIINQTTVTTAAANTSAPKDVKTNKHLSPYERAIMSLYDNLTLKCSSCGLRFVNKDELDAHKDKHFQMNTKRNQSKALSRKWYQTEDSWLTKQEEFVLESPGAVFFHNMSVDDTHQISSIPTGDEKPAEDTSNNPVRGVSADETQEFCTICGEHFETAYDDKTDEWYYKDTVRDSQSNLVVHRVCQSALYMKMRSPLTPLKVAPSNGATPASVFPNLADIKDEDIEVKEESSGKKRMSTTSVEELEAQSDLKKVKLE